MKTFFTFLMAGALAIALAIGGRHQGPGPAKRFKVLQISVGLLSVSSKLPADAVAAPAPAVLSGPAEQNPPLITTNN